MKKLLFLLVLNVLSIANVLAQEELSEFNLVEVMPEFLEYKGKVGEQALMSFLGENIHYPDSAAAQGVQGVVYVSFIIEKNGKVSSAKVLKGVNPYLDDEALRVISDMPKWKPGKQKGKNVRVQFSLPIRFSL